MIGVIGASHRTASLATLEKFATAFLALCSDSGVLLQTCNRVEWYFSAQNPSEIHEKLISALRSHVDREKYSLYTLFGAECFYHLGRVTSGLDSLFVGETEIQGQVKGAYETARKHHTLPKEIHFLFQKALHTGKIIRSLLKKPHHENLTNHVVRLISKSLLHVRQTHTLLIGASMTNKRIGAELVKLGIPVTVCNRTDAHAYAFTEEIGGKMIQWDLMGEVWHRFPCVIAATKSPYYLLSPPAPDSEQLLVDLGLPRNIDPLVASSQRKLYNIGSFSPSEELDSLLAQRTRSDFQRYTAVKKSHFLGNGGME